MYLIEREPIVVVGVLDEPHCLGIHLVVGYGVVEGGNDVGDVERQKAAVARLVGEKLELVARGAVGGEAQTALLGGAVGCAHVDVGHRDERFQLVEVAP